MGYVPKLDNSPLLDAAAADYFTCVIGVVRWCIEIRRIDICTKVSLLSAYLAAPREGHLEAALHVMSYLRGKHNSRLTFYPSYTNADIKNFNDGAGWKELDGSQVDMNCRQLCPA